MNWSHLFRIKPKYNLLATRPIINGPKDHIVDLTAVIGTDGPPHPFTMNGRIPQRGEVRFDEGAPLCAAR